MATPRSRGNKVITLAAEPAAAYAVKEPGRVLSFMGLSSRSSPTPERNARFIQLIRQGIPKKVIDTILTKTSMSESDLAAFLHVSLRTIQRRQPEDLLDPGQSERLIELARLYSLGEEVFGDMATFSGWMDTEIIALGHKSPKAFLDTSIGISILMEELGRLEHGVYS